MLVSGFALVMVLLVDFVDSFVCGYSEAMDAGPVQILGC